LPVHWECGRGDAIPDESAAADIVQIINPLWIGTPASHWGSCVHPDCSGSNFGHVWEATEPSGFPSCARMCALCREIVHLRRWELISELVEGPQPPIYPICPAARDLFALRAAATKSQRVGRNDPEQKRDGNGRHSKKNQRLRRCSLRSGHWGRRLVGPVEASSA
jgi:hypothetical protein